MSSPALHRDVTEDIVALLEHGALETDGPVRRIDTHAASVFLTRDRAWKLKRPVRYGYLDFSTPARRRAALEAELTLNRRTAPDLYVAVHAITRTPDGQLALDGAGEAIDWLLEMHRFADDALLDDRARHGALDPGLAARLAECIARFHAEAPIIQDRDGAGRVAAVIDGNAAGLAGFPALFPPDAVAMLLARQRGQLERVAGALDMRARRGRVRHCHGDLHLANIAMIDGEPVPFDCLEFDAALATTDILYDLAFLIMDMWHRGLRAAANRLFNRYLDLSGDDEDGIGAMPLFLSLRATIRAHVTATRGQVSRLAADNSLASRYFALAGQLLDRGPCWLVAVGGRSGTGKSVLAVALGDALGAAPGARILRSDVLRKRLAGVAPETALAAACYTPRNAAQVYRVLGEQASALLGDGGCVIVDAAFLDIGERRAIQGAAEAVPAGFLGLWLEAGEPARVARVMARGRDASDADATVVRRQSAQPVGPIEPWHRLDAGRPPEMVAQAARELLRRTMSGAERA